MSNIIFNSYIKTAVEGYSWTHIITLYYTSRKAFDNSHRRRFLQWLSGRKISYFWVCELSKLNVPVYKILIDNILEKQEVQDKWNSLVAGGRVDIKAIENKEQDLRPIFNYLDKDLSYNAQAKLKTLKINDLFSYSGIQFLEYLGKCKEEHETYLREAELKVEEETLETNALKVRNMLLNDKDLAPFLKIFSEQQFVDKFSEEVNKNVTSLRYSTFQDTTPEKKKFILDAISGADKKLLLELLLIHVFAAAGKDSREEKYPSFLHALAVDSLYANLDYLSRKSNEKITFIEWGYIPEFFAKDIGLSFVECLNNTYVDLFLIKSSAKQNPNAKEDGSVVELEIKTENAIMKEIIDRCTKSFYFIRSLPMIVEPAPWSSKDSKIPVGNLTTFFKGGYLKNNERKFCSLIRTTHAHRVELIDNEQNILRAIDTAQQVPFSINWELLSLIKEKIAVKEIEKDNAEVELKRIKADKTELFKKAKKNKSGNFEFNEKEKAILRDLKVKNYI